MFLWGLLSLVQACILPGYILYNIFIGRTGLIKSLPYVFSLSLIFNWIVVFYFTLFHLYEKNNLLIIILIELILIIIINIKKINIIIKEDVKIINNKEYLLEAIGKLAVAYAFLRVLPKFGRVFTMGDAIAYWNRCAIEWANNTIPTETMHYPQLLPSNYSLSYVLMGSTEIEFFAFAISAFFFPLASLALFQLAKNTKNLNFHIVNLLFCLYVSIFQEIAIGYADLPVACMSLIAFCVLYEAYINRFRKTHTIKMVCLSVILACGAAATKQAGIYYAVFHMFICLYWAYKCYPIKKILNFSIFMLVANILIYGLWYVYAQNKINNGLSSSEINYVTQDIFEGKNLIQRTYYAFLNWPYFYFMTLASLVALIDKRLRFICLTTIGYVIIWSFYFSYDRRNFALALPFLAINLGLPYHIYIDRCKKISEKLNNRFIILSITIVFLSLAAMIPNEKLFNLQSHQKIKWNSKI